MKLRNILAGAGVLAALAMANGASAGTYNLGTLSPNHPLSQSVVGDMGTVDDVFTFTITNPTSLQTFAQELNLTITDPGVLDPSTTIGIYTTGGVAIGTPQTLAVSEAGPGGISVGASLKETIGAGTYQVEVLGSTDPANAATDYTLGVFGAVPEPASWAMMTLGLGLVGATLRVRARREQGLTA